MEYKTEDGHIMKKGEIMWRVCNTSGTWEGPPGDVIYSEFTGYNCGPDESPFPKEQKHFYDYNKAVKYLSEVRSKK